MQGGPANNATAGKVARLCHCSLRQSRSRRSQSQNSSESSPWPYGQRSINRIQGDTDTTVVVYAGNKVKKYSVKKHDTGNTGTMFSADVSPDNCPPECNGGGLRRR